MQHPLVVAIDDGAIKEVCAHPQDETNSINMKKGVMSLLQNSLPNMDPLSSWLMIEEVC